MSENARQDEKDRAKEAERALELPAELCQEDDTKLAEENAQLQQRLEHERDARKEERFYWVVVATILVDMISFPHLGAYHASLIFLLEIVSLIGFARSWGVDWIVEFLEKVLFYLLKGLRNGQ